MTRSTTATPRTFRQRATAMIGGLALAGAAVVGGSVATAPAAEAQTKSSCQTQTFNDGLLTWRQVTCYFSFTAFEKTFQGKRDGYYVQVGSCTWNWAGTSRPYYKTDGDASRRVYTC